MSNLTFLLINVKNGLCIVTNAVCSAFLTFDAIFLYLYSCILNLISQLPIASINLKMEQNLCFSLLTQKLESKLKTVTGPTHCI